MPPTPDDDHIGATLNGYIIEAALIRDQGVSVYQGRGVYTRRKVLIKLLESSHLNAALLRLDHPHIQPILALGSYEDQAYVITPQTEHGTLTEVVGNVVLPYEQMLHWLKQAAGALDYAHQHEILHGNLTPDALFLDGFGNLTISDFALPTAPPTPYSAPEVWSGYHGGKTSDLYGLGAIAYHLIVGEPPFYDQDSELIRDRVLFDQPAPPTRASQPSNLALNIAIGKALAKDPLGRYQSAGEFIDDLQTALDLPGIAPEVLPAADEQEFERVSLWASGASEPQGQSFAPPSDKALIGCAWLPEGETFLVADAAGSIYQMGVEDPAPVLVISTGQSCLAFALAEEGEHFAILGEAIHLYSREGECLQTFTSENCRRLSLAANGLLLASCHNDGYLRLWDSLSGDQVLEINAHKGAVNTLSLSENGQLLLSGGADSVLRLWNARSGEKVQQFSGHEAPISACALKGELVLSGDSEGSLFVWDILMQDKPISLKGHGDAITDCHIQQVGDLILGASSSADGTLRLWDLRSGVELRQFDAAAPIQHCALNDRYILFGLEDAHLVLEDHTRSAQPSGHQNTVADLRVQGEIMFSIGIDGSWQQTALHDGKRLFNQALDLRPTCLETAGQYVFIGYAEGILQCFDRESRRLRWESTAHQAEISFLHMSDDRQVISGGADSILASWNIVSGARTSALAIQSANLRCAVGSHGLSIVGTQEGQISAWDVMTGNQHQQYGLFDQPITALALAGGVLVAGLGDGRIAHWTADAPDSAVLFQAHSSSIAALALNTDGRTLLSSGLDGTLCLWDLAAGQQVETWRLERAVTQARWADPQTLLWGDEDGALGCLTWVPRH